MNKIWIQFADFSEWLITNNEDFSQSKTRSINSSNCISNRLSYFIYILKAYFSDFLIKSCFALGICIRSKFSLLFHIQMMKRRIIFSDQPFNYLSVFVGIKILLELKNYFILRNLIRKWFWNLNPLYHLFSVVLDRNIVLSSQYFNRFSNLKKLFHQNASCANLMLIYYFHDLN